MERQYFSTCGASHLVFFLILIVMEVTSRGMVIENNGLFGNTTVLECVGNSTGSELYVVWTLANGTRFHHYSPSTKRDLAATEFCFEEKFCSVMTGDENGALLVIEEVNFEDVGIYHCLKVFMRSATSENIQFSLQVKGHPRLRVQDSHSTSEFISAECCVDVSSINKDDNIQWVLDEVPNVPIAFRKDKESFSNRNSTICSFIKFERSGHYHRKILECLFRDAHDVISTTSTRLDVWYAANVMAERSLNTSTPILVDINKEFSITCVADGSPLPTVQLELLSDNRWMKAEMQATELHEEHKNSWTFRHSGIEKDTIFRCTAENGFDENAVSDNILVEVMYIKEVKIINKTLEVAKNSDFNISCQTNGKPPPDVYLVRSRDSIDWNKVNSAPITVANDGHLTTVNFLVTAKESKIKDYSFKCKAFTNSTNEIVESSAVRLEIHVTFSEWVKTNLNSIVIVGVGIVVIITIIATGASRRRKSLYNFYNTIRPGNNDAASYNRTDVTATPRPPPPISASIPDLCRLGSSNSSAYDNPKGSVYYDCNDDYDEVHTSSENLDLRIVDSLERRPQRDDASYSLTYKRGVKFEQESNLDVQYSTDHGKFESTFGKDTYSGYDI